MRGGDGGVGVAAKAIVTYLSLMEKSHDPLQMQRQQLVEMLMSIKDEALLLQIQNFMLDAGVAPSEEIRTMADLEARFRKVERDFAEGRYITMEELMAKMAARR
jgi:hypothetical protein